MVRNYHRKMDAIPFTTDRYGNTLGQGEHSWFLLFTFSLHPSHNFWSPACACSEWCWIWMWGRTFHTDNQQCPGVSGTFACLLKPWNRFCMSCCPSECQSDCRRIFQWQTISDTGCKRSARWFWKYAWASSLLEQSKLRRVGPRRRLQSSRSVSWTCHSESISLWHTKKLYFAIYEIQINAFQKHVNWIILQVNIVSV